MGAAGEQAEAIFGFVVDLAFGQDAPADADHGVGGERDRGGELRPFARRRGGDGRLLGGEPLGQRARRLVAARRLLDVGGDHRVGLDADLRQQRQATRRAGSEDKAGALGVGHAALLTREASMAFRAYLKR